MIALKILRQCAIKPTQTLSFVTNCVRMNDIDDDAQTELMRRIDQLFEIVGRAKTRTNRKKIRHVIAKTTIIRMFLNRHQLNRVVAGFFDTWQNIMRKLLE